MTGSDILAEIDLPRAGLHHPNFDNFPYPDGYIQESLQQSSHPARPAPYDEIMQFYSSQLHIRGILNQTQHTVYVPSACPRSSLDSLPSNADQRLDTDPKSSRHRPTIHILDEFIHDLRNRLPPGLKWSDNDSQSTYINHARLRGKWYGAQYIIHRPYLHYALELDENGTLDDYMYRQHLTSEKPRMPPPSDLQGKDELIRTVLKSAGTCISAAQHSTTAFDGIMDHRRLVVTNIFGTSHA